MHIEQVDSGPIFSHGHNFRMKCTGHLDITPMGPWPVFSMGENRMRYKKQKADCEWISYHVPASYCRWYMPERAMISLAI